MRMVSAYDNRLKIAWSRFYTDLDEKNKKDVEHESSEAENEKEGRIVTTQDEIDGYNIIKAILRKTVDVNRVVMRDTASYCGILLDDNNRKTICRLLFNNPKNLSILLFDVDKKESRYPLENVDGIYHFADEVIESVVDIDKKVLRKAIKENTPESTINSAAAEVGNDLIFARNEYKGKLY